MKHATLRNNASDGQFKYTFEKGKNYELCFENVAGIKKHVFFEFPLQISTAIGTASEVGEGVTLLKQLALDIEQTAQTVRETLSKTTVYDMVYDEMESSLIGSLLLKGLVLLIICGLQCWLFVRMVGKKVLEYKRVSIPI